MDDELRMQLADLGSPEILAATIVHHYGTIDLPIPLYRIAHDVGINEIIAADTASFEGILVADVGKSAGSIAYNSTSRLERARFTIAHELGHFLIPTHDARAQCGKAELGIFKSTNSRHAKEAEANRFAANLIMPHDFFVPQIRRLGSPELAHVIELAKRFCVSREAAARRYVELAEDDCVVIFSHNGVIRYACRSEDMPALSVRKGD